MELKLENNLAHQTMPVEGVEKLVAFMKDFEKNNK